MEYETAKEKLRSFNELSETIKSRLDLQRGLLCQSLNDATPFGRLPVEVLVRIVELYLDIYKEYPLAFHDSRTALALVSKKFHTVVQNTASLWTYVGAGFSSTLIKKSIEQSQGLGLNIRSVKTDPDVDDPAVVLLWESLSHEAHRLRSVVSNASEPFRQYVIKSKLPNVETVDIFEEQALSNPVVFSDFGKCSQGLKVLNVTGPWGEENQLYFSFRGNTLENLRSLKLWDVTSSGWPI